MRLQLLVATALVIASCASAGEKAGSDISDSLSDGYAFTISFRVDDEFAGSVNRVVPGEVVIALNAIDIVGTVKGDALTLSGLFASGEFLEIVTIDGATVFTRLDIDSVLERLPIELDIAPYRERLEQAVGAELASRLLDGEWLGMRLGRVADLQAALRSAIGQDLGELVERFATVSADARVDETTREVTAEIDLERLFQDLLAGWEPGDAPALIADAAANASRRKPLPITLRLRFNQLTRVVMNLADAINGLGGRASGALEVTADLTRHGQVEPPTLPELPAGVAENVVDVDVTALLELTGLLQGLLGDS